MSRPNTVDEDDDDSFWRLRERERLRGQAEHLMRKNLPRRGLECAKSSMELGRAVFGEDDEHPELVFDYALLAAAYVGLGERAEAIPALDRLSELFFGEHGRGWWDLAVMHAGAGVLGDLYAAAMDPGMAHEMWSIQASPKYTAIPEFDWVVRAAERAQLLRGRSAAWAPPALGPMERALNWIHELRAALATGVDTDGSPASLKQGLLSRLRGAFPAAERDLSAARWQLTQTHGEGSVAVSPADCELGRLFLAWDKPDQALRCFQRAYVSRFRHSGPPDDVPATAEALRLLNEARSRLGLAPLPSTVGLPQGAWTGLAGEETPPLRGARVHSRDTPSRGNTSHTARALEAAARGDQKRSPPRAQRIRTLPTRVNLASWFSRVIDGDNPQTPPLDRRRDQAMVEEEEDSDDDDDDEEDEEDEDDDDDSLLPLSAPWSGGQRKVENWSNADILDWLHRVELGHHEEAFRHEEVRGSDVLLLADDSAEARHVLSASLGVADPVEQARFQWAVERLPKSSTSGPRALSEVRRDLDARSEALTPKMEQPPPPRGFMTRTWERESETKRVTPGPFRPDSFRGLPVLASPGPFRPTVKPKTTTPAAPAAAQGMSIEVTPQAGASSSDPKGIWANLGNSIMDAVRRGADPRQSVPPSYQASVDAILEMASAMADTELFLARMHGGDGPNREDILSGPLRLEGMGKGGSDGSSGPALTIRRNDGSAAEIPWKALDSAVRQFIGSVTGEKEEEQEEGQPEQEEALSRQAGATAGPDRTVVSTQESQEKQETSTAQPSFDRPSSRTGADESVAAKSAADEVDGAGGPSSSHQQSTGGVNEEDAGEGTETGGHKTEVASSDEPPSPEFASDTLALPRKPSNTADQPTSAVASPPAASSSAAEEVGGEAIKEGSAPAGHVLTEEPVPQAQQGHGEKGGFVRDTAAPPMVTPARPPRPASRGVGRGEATPLRYAGEGVWAARSGTPVSIAGDDDRASPATVVRRSGDGRRVKMLALSGYELWLQLRTFLGCVGITQRLPQESRVGRWSAKLGFVGLLRRLRVQKWGSSRGSRIFARMLGPFAVKMKVRGMRQTKLGCVGWLVASARWRNEAKDNAKRMMLKKARKVKPKSDAPVKRTKNIQWEIMDNVRGTLWDHGTLSSPGSSMKEVFGVELSPDPSPHSGQRSLRSSERLRGHQRSRSSMVLDAWMTQQTDVDVHELVHHPAQQKVVSTLFSDLHDTFAAKSPSQVAKRRASGVSGAKGAASALVRLFDDRTSRNLSIGLKRLGKLPWEDVAVAIEIGDMESLGGSEVVQVLLGLNCYDGQPAAQVKNYLDGGGDANRLPEAEQFVARVVLRVSNIPQRLEAMDLRARFHEIISPVESNIDSVSKASVEVRTSAKLVVLLRDVILALGNELNRYSSRAAASGVRLSSLTKLTHTRGADNETLLEYIVRKLLDAAERGESAASLLQLEEDMPHVSAAAQTSLPVMTTDVSRLMSDVRKVEQFVRSLARDGGMSEGDMKQLETSTSPEDDDVLQERAGAFARRFLPFAARADRRVRSLQRSFRAMQTSFQATCEYLGEDPSSSTLEDVFGVLAQFLRDLNTVHERVKKRRAEEEARARRAAQREARKAAKAGAGAGAGAGNARAFVGRSLGDDADAKNDVRRELAQRLRQREEGEATQRETPRPNATIPEVDEVELDSEDEGLPLSSSSSIQPPVSQKGGDDGSAAVAVQEDKEEGDDRGSRESRRASQVSRVAPPERPPAPKPRSRRALLKAASPRRG